MFWRVGAWGRVVFVFGLVLMGIFGRRVYLRYRPLPENVGDYAGPLERVPAAYDRSRAPSRPWVDGMRVSPAPLTYHRYAARSIGGADTDYLLYLPPGYWLAENASRRYPVIYWLHGFSAAPQHGIAFVEGLDAAIRAGVAPPVIVVAPNGLVDSWYVDSVNGAQPVESVIIRDLIPHVDGTYRTIADRRGRALEGFSMGAWGAGHLGFKYPELFCAVTMVSPPLHTHASFPQLYPIFSMDAAAYYAEDPVTRARRDVGRLKGMVRLRVFTGEADWMSRFAHRFNGRLTEWGWPHEFKAVAGAGHDDSAIYEGLGGGVFGFYGEVFGR